MENITYKLDPALNRNPALMQAANEIKSRLEAKFGVAYAISAGDLPEADKNWTHEIKVRQGSKIGAAVDMTWDKSAPEIVKLDVTESSKMGSTIMLSFIAAFTLAGAYMGYNDIEPLAFLPGHKIAGGLGGLIGLIPGAILGGILKSVLLKGEKETNAKLVNEVRQALQDL